MLKYILLIFLVNICSFISVDADIQSPEDAFSIFPKNIEDIERNFQFVKRHVNARVEHIISIPPKGRTFENTVLEYDRTNANFRTQGSILATLKMVHPDSAIQKKAEELLKDWSNILIDQLESNKDMYRAFKEYQREGNRESLSDERQYYLFNALASFRRAGLDLDETKYNEMKELQKEIASLSMQFHTNIDQNNTTITFKRGQLTGIDENFINSLKREYDQYTLVCDYPTYFQVLTNCSIESTRRAYYHVFNNRAFPQNLDILKRLIDRRKTLAHLFGYSNYSEFDIEPEMAKKYERVDHFLKACSLDSEEHIKANWEMMLADLPESVQLIQEGKVKAWDAAYISNHYIKHHLHVDPNEVAEYFPMESTIQGLLGIYAKFFNLEFKLCNNACWDPSVQTIEVRDSGDDHAVMGYVLLDLFPRPNKYSHCCCNGILPPLTFDGGKTYNPAVAVVIANFSKSNAEKPSLLKHHEVVTFFHEFGHALHAIFGRCEMPTKAAYNTKMDFIETPSQLLEEWMWDREILKRISRHFQTGEPLPDAMIDGLIKTRTLKDAAHLATAGNSDHLGTETMFAKLALSLFGNDCGKDPMQIEHEVYLSTPQIIAYDQDIHYLCQFGHLTAYGAKYYTYPWSKKLALKIFDYIKSHGGLLDPAMGLRYRSTIIGRGGSCDPNDMLTDFFEDN